MAIADVTTEVRGEAVSAYRRDPRIQILHLHWALKSVNIRVIWNPMVRASGLGLRALGSCRA